MEFNTEIAGGRWLWDLLEDKRLLELVPGDAAPPALLAPALEYLLQMLRKPPYHTAVGEMPYNSGTDRPQNQSKEGGEATQGEVWRGRGAETYGKCNVLAGPLWEAPLTQPLSSLKQS